MKLNLGCGDQIKEGYVNLDIIPFKGVDVLHDMNKFPYPFKDNTFEEVIAVHVLEHTQDLFKTMQELFRICKDKAILKIIVPHYTHSTAFTCPDHKRFFGIDSLGHFGGLYFQYRCKAKFALKSNKLVFNRYLDALTLNLMGKLFNKVPRFYENYLSSFIPAGSIHTQLRVIKNFKIRDSFKSKLDHGN